MSLSAKEIKKRYNQIQRALVDITPKVLSQRLKEMEANDLIKRKVHAQETPVRVEYEITPKGKDLRTIIECLRDWGNKWMYDGKHLDYCDLCSKFRIENPKQFGSKK
ncbi:MAG: helix-turn-helix domain-containing protein [Candidatus Altiarchaeota archaeon]